VSQLETLLRLDRSLSNDAPERQNSFQVRLSSPSGWPVLQQPELPIMAA
jgi:hypothetical protein